MCQNYNARLNDFARNVNLGMVRAHSLQQTTKQLAFDIKYIACLLGDASRCSTSARGSIAMAICEVANVIQERCEQ